MKATIEYILPDEQYEHRQAVYAREAWMALQELDEEMRRISALKRPDGRIADPAGRIPPWAVIVGVALGVLVLGGIGLVLDDVVDPATADSIAANEALLKVKLGFPVRVVRCRPSSGLLPRRGIRPMVRPGIPDFSGLAVPRSVRVVMAWAI